MSNGMKTILAMVVCLLAFSFVNAKASDGEVKQSLGVTPQKMIGIAMKEGDALHDLHSAKVEEAGKDCTVCHIDENYEAFMAVDKEKSQDDKVAYVHKNCVKCHTELGKGPHITACRSCHTDKYAVK